MKKTNEIRIYAAGGGACNIVSELESTLVAGDVGFASTLPCYIDTSKSNLINKKIDEAHTYFFEGMDGSGKVRAANYEEITKNALAILQKFKPTMFNIVVHTASGGSGSVIAPVLVSELKSRGEQVIVITVGSTDTRIEIENTIKTLKSYESIAGLRKSPVVMHYVQNTEQLSRQAVNKQVKIAISLLCGLFSGQNEELDTADLKNWMEYLKFSNGPAQLVSLNFVTDQKDLDTFGTVVSVATLAVPHMNTRLANTVPAYQCVGYVPEVWRMGATDGVQLIGDEPIHYTISTDFITKATTALNTTLKDVDAAYASRVARTSILDRDDHATDNGLVL